MMKIEIVENVESNDVDGGYIVVDVFESNDVCLDGCEYRNERVMLSFDWGESLCGVEIVDESNEVIEYKDLEKIFSIECVEKLWGMNFK
tara:strand:+ start:748 stop:1014 length:267 start_codon:yes stop_codon:yes gene_type:complete